MSPVYVDLHTHFPARIAGAACIQNRYFGSAEAGAGFFSAGLHPWYLPDEDLSAAKAWLDGQLLHPACIAVGEAGLDKLSAVPPARQKAAFAYCIEKAIASDKPLIVHCVKAYEETLQMLKGRAGLPPVVFHGFNKHPQTARMLLDAGCLLSFGGALFQPNSRAAEALGHTPLTHFFLETDDRPELDIRLVYEKAAAIKGLSVATLAAQIRENFERVFRFAPVYTRIGEDLSDEQD